MPKSRRYCCVVDCFNAECKGLKNLRFYSFPSKNYETDRKRKWISAVRRKNPDGSIWVPNSNSRICSDHFYAGKKSNIETHPAYIPTIFPYCYTKSTSHLTKDCDTDREAERCEEGIDPLPILYEPSESKFKSIGLQACLMHIKTERFVIECTQIGNNCKMVQCFM